MACFLEDSELHQNFYPEPDAKNKSAPETMLLFAVSDNYLWQGANINIDILIEFCLSIKMSTGTNTSTFTSIFW
jgi:hypothetical protein